ncbi:MAG: hypothetical protein ACLQU1_35035 [Bryobacteraceae bacterium]
MLLEHLQPVPDTETKVSRVGIESVTVTSPVVAPPDAPFDTVTVYVALCCPRAKLPACVLETVRRLVAGG